MSFADYLKKNNPEKYRRMTGEASSSKNSNGFKEYLKKNNPEKYKRIAEGIENDSISDPNDVLKWWESASDFMKDATEFYKGNSSKYSFKDKHKDYDYKIKSTLESGQSVLDYLDQNKDSLVNYEDMRKSVESVLDVFGNFDTAYSDVNDFYSQFETEEDYNAYKDAVRQQTKTQNLNLAKAETEVRALEQQLKTVRDRADKAVENGTMSIDDASKGIKDLEAALGEKKREINLAKRYNRSQELSSVTSASDFKELSEKGAQVENPTYEEAHGGFSLGTWRPYEQEIKNKVTFANDQENIRKLAQDQFAANMGGGANLEDVYQVQREYTYLTDEEKSIYNYYIGKGDTATADEYLESLTDTLNYRIATEDFEKLYKDQAALEFMFSAAAGIDQFISGMQANFTDADYIPQSKAQHMSGMIREDLADVGGELPEWMGGGSVGQMFYDMGTSTANMLPSILVSMIPVVGQFAGPALMGMSSGGNAYAEMINLGYDKDQARMYAGMVGGSEAGLQYVLGGISALGGKVSGNVIAKFVNKVDNALARTAIKLGGSMGSEFSEEYLQEVLTPVYRNIAFNEQNEVELFSEEALYAGLLGAMTSSFLEGGGTISGEVNNYTTGKALDKAGIKYTDLTSLAGTYSADSLAYQLAGRVDENTGAYTIGRLFNEMGATLTEQNVADITENLKAQGVDARSANILASALVDVVNGNMSLTEAQAAALEANDTLSRAVVETVINPNSTEYQRTSNYYDMLDRLAREMTAESSATAASEETVGQTEKAITEENTASEDIGLDEALVAETIASMNVNPSAANILMENFKSPANKLSAEVYSKGIEEAYRYGSLSIPVSDMMRNGAFSKDLSRHQRTQAYNLGEQAAKAEVAKQQAKIDSIVAKKGGKNANINGKVHFDRANRKFNAQQESALAVMDVISAATGTDIYVFESYELNGERVYKNKAGKIVAAPNGFYDPKDGSIHIDLNAGATGRGTMLFTAAHEFTHKIKDSSPAKYKLLADTLMKAYASSGVSVDALVQRQISKAKKAGRELSYEEAYDEVIADSMESILQSGNVLEKLAEIKKQDKSLWQAIVNFFKDFAAKIRQAVAAYKGFSPDSIEGRMIAEMKDFASELEQIYTDALADVGNVESDIVNIDAETQSVAPMFSERTWTRSEYVQEREKTAKAISKELKVDLDTAYKYIDDINSVAALIADDRARLDYEPNMDENATVLKPNSDYKYSVDMSTLCAKRLLTTGTFDAIQRLLPETVFSSEDLVALREMMMERGYEVACGICYVESTRREMGRITQDFINSYKESQKTGKPITRTNSKGKVVNLIKTKAEKESTTDKTSDKFYADKNYTPTLADLNTTDIDLVKRDHPLVYEAYLNFMNARGQAKPKLLETRAEYKGEILKNFKQKSAVKSRNAAGGLRLQSFSDFEVPHMIDMMQIVMDMSRVGLKSQAYTKVPAFAEVFGNTGVKINLSLIAKGSGLDADGNLIFDDVEGMNHKEAFKLRDKFSKNVGTILVGKSEEHIIAAMADPRIDFIIPFHKSSWKESLYDSLGLTGYEDFTDTQNEKYIDKSRGKTKNFDPSEYWDFNKTGEENAQVYLQKCKEDGRIPKFPQFQNYEGYWKLLIDFKMYDNNGVGSPQEVVHPTFETDAANKILSEYKGGHRNFPVAKDVVNDFVKQHNDEIQAAKDNNKFSLRNDAEETKDLLAMHNITPQLLTDALSRNGLIMPSIAVTNKGLTEFGDISLVFDKKTIDPNETQQNKLFGSDAWTPAQMNLKMNAKFDKNKSSSVVSNLKSNLESMSAESLFSDTAEEFERKISKAKGSVYTAYAHDIGMQAAYAIENGLIDNVPLTKDGAVDKVKLQEELDKKLDTDAEWRVYKRWLASMSDEVITKYSQASNKDIMKNMKSQPKTAKPFRISETGELTVPSVEYSSIDEARSNKHRLSEDPSADVKKVSDSLINYAKKISNSSGASFSNVIKAINSSFDSRYDAAGIADSFNAQGINISQRAASELQNLYKDAVELPTPYFESKPGRYVGFSEVKAAIVPDTQSAELSNLKAELENRGISIMEYKAGSKESRLEALNSQEHLKFSDRGNGYDGYSMSNNARDAYANDEMPLSKWNKSSLISAIHEVNPDIDCSRLTVDTLKNEFLEKTSWHHTSKMYNRTDFYSIKENFVQALTQDDVDNIAKEQVSKTKVKRDTSVDSKVDEAYSKIQVLIEAGIIKSETAAINRIVSGKDIEEAYNKAVDIIRRRDAAKVEQWRKLPANHYRQENVKLYDENIHEYIRKTYLSYSTFKLSRNSKAFKKMAEYFAEQGSDIKHSLRDTTKPDTFYSQMSRVIDGIKDNKIGAGDVVRYLTRRGVRNEEIKWSGIEEFLKGKKSVTKQELQEFAAASMLQIEESTIDQAETPMTKEQKEKIAALEKKRDDIARQAKKEWKRVFGTDELENYNGDGLPYNFSTMLIDAIDNKNMETPIGQEYKAARQAAKEMLEKSDYFGYDNAQQALSVIERDSVGFLLSIEATPSEEAVIKRLGRATAKLLDMKDVVPEADIKKLRDLSDAIWLAGSMITDINSEHHDKQKLPRWGDYKLKGGKNYREIVFRMPESTYTNGAMYAHWGEFDMKGVLAHTRVQDFEVDGKKMLFIEEIQSDWHNEGQKQGYFNEGDKATKNNTEMRHENGWYNLYRDGMDLHQGVSETFLRQRFRTTGITDEEIHEGLVEEYNRAVEHSGKGWKAPDAPFRDTYHEFVLKRLIREAAENGYDSIGWTTAQTQDERWKDNRHHEEGKGKSGNLVGYTIEYDQKMRSFMKRFGDKWGVKVEKTTLENGKLDSDGNPRFDGGNHSTEIWSMPITDAMKESVMTEGQPLYSERETDSVSNRSLLANAFEGVAQNEIEQKKIAQYKSQVERLDAENQKLNEINAEIKELSFAKGARDTARIKQLRDEATKTANRINTLDKQLLNLEASKPLQAVLQREKQNAYKRATEKGKQALQDYRMKADERIQKVYERVAEKNAKLREQANERILKAKQSLMAKHAESRKNATERRNRKETRRKIQKVVKDLRQFLLRPDKKKHVPINMQKAVAEALDIVNMDTVGAEERIAKYDALIAKTEDPEVLASLTETRDRIASQGSRMAEKLERLHSAYEEFIESDDPDIANAYDEVISNLINSTAKEIGETSIKDMSLEQLESVYDMYKAVLTRVRDSNKSFADNIKERINDIAGNVFGELSALKDKKRVTSKIGKDIAQFSWNNTKPVYAFERVGSPTLSRLYKNIRKGEDTWAVDIEEAKAFSNSVKEKYGYKKWDMYKEYEFESATGKKFTLNLEEMMSIYAEAKREADIGTQHLRKGGFIYDDNAKSRTKKVLGLKTKVIPEDATFHKLNDQLIQDIISTMDSIPGVRGFVDEMQGYLSTDMGAKGNEVSMAMYGIKLYKEKNYFPLHVSSDYNARIEAKQKGEVKIKNAGFTKEINTKASAPIVLTPFMDVWAEHVNDMAMYHSFVLPLEDFYRVYNSNSGTSEQFEAESIKQQIKAKHGAAATGYIEQLLKDVNGDVRSDPRESTFKGFVSGFKKAAVMASLSVVIQQPSSFARALSMIDARDFMYKPSKLSPNKLWEEVKKYAPIAIIKEMGKFDTDVGQSTVDYLKDKRDASTVIDKALGTAPAMADQITWNHIWMAVKHEIARKNKDIEVGSEEFFKKAGERFTEVITKTQVYDSVFSRSANMRSKNAFMQMLTAFMAEPTTTLNMYQDAIRQGKMGYKKAAARTVASIYASIALNSALSSIVYAMRDDDEDETWIEKYLQSFSREMADGINPLTYYPGIKDAWSIMQGFSVERADMSMVQDLWTAVETFSAEAAKDTAEMDEAQLTEHDEAMITAAHDLASAMSSLFGVPVGNIIREVKAGINTYDVANSGLGEDATLLWDRVLESLRTSVPILGKTKIDQKDKLYETIVRGDQAYVDRIKATYKDEEAYEKALRTALRENDSRIKEAAEAKYSGDIARYKNLFKEIKGEGAFGEKTILAAINSEFNKLKPEEESSTADKESSIFNIESAVQAAINGDRSTAIEAKEDIIRVAMANGKSKDQATTSFNNSFNSNVKDKFDDGVLNATEAKRMLETVGGKTSEEALDKVRYWEVAKRYPNADISEEAVAGFYKPIEDLGYSMEDAGISMAAYVNYKTAAKTCKGVDSDGDGKTDNGSKKAEILLVIDALDLTPDQKDALYFDNGWAASKLHEAPWR